MYIIPRVSVLAICVAFGAAAHASETTSRSLAVPVAEKAGAAGVRTAAPYGAAKVLNRGDAVLNPGGKTDGAIYAGTSIKCGDTVYSITTGWGGGKCTGTGKARSCTDGKGNAARVSCSTGCGTTSGAGKCTIKAAD